MPLKRKKKEKISVPIQNRKKEKERSYRAFGTSSNGRLCYPIHQLHHCKNLQPSAKKTNKEKREKRTSAWPCHL
jgi:hypothetical protein